MNSQIETTKASVERLLDIDLSKLPREEILGKHLSFAAAVEPAKLAINVFKRLPLSQFEELPDAELKTIQRAADALFNIIDSINNFDPNDPNNNTNRRDQIVDQLRGQHQTVFSAVFPLISYLTVRATDFSTLENDARSVVQSAKDEVSNLAKSMKSSEEEAQQVLKTIRKTAAEQGVSQEAIYFKEEAESHDTSSKTWAMFTVCTAVGFGIFALLSLFLHKIPFLSPENTYEASQLIVSKLLIFGVLSYMLILCARNFLSHKHNSVVNRHRQNALVTFKALVDAATAPDKQDIVLANAASCIFSPQETGFSRGSQGSATGATGNMQMLTRILNPASGHEPQ